MKRFLLIIATVAFIVTSASLAGAWQVNIKNSCNKDVNISVTGEHLFWKQVDCRATVAKGTTGVCQLPGAICPYDIKGNYMSGGSSYDLNLIHCTSSVSDVCCCWDVNVEVIQYGADSCKLKNK